MHCHRGPHKLERSRDDQIRTPLTRLHRRVPKQIRAPDDRHATTFDLDSERNGQIAKSPIGLRQQSGRPRSRPAPGETPNARRQHECSFHWRIAAPGIERVSEPTGFDADPQAKRVGDRILIVDSNYQPRSGTNVVQQTMNFFRSQIRARRNHSMHGPRVDARIEWRQPPLHRPAEAFRKLAAVRPPADNNVVIVTHKPNIVDAFGKYWLNVSEGEASVFEPDGTGGYRLIARVQASEWSRLAQERD